MRHGGLIGLLAVRPGCGDCGLARGLPRRRERWQEARRAVAAAAEIPAEQLRLAATHAYLKAGFAFSASVGYARADCFNRRLTIARAISTAAGNAPIRLISW